MLLREQLRFPKVPNLSNNWFETIIYLYDQSPIDVNQRSTPAAKKKQRKKRNSL